MKKLGFTLAETLIALVIIGIIAALIIPAISKVKPDETKSMYLRTQRAVSLAVKNYAAGLNPCSNDNCYSNYPIYAKEAKALCEYLANNAFNTKDGVSCKNEYVAFNNADPDWSFVTMDGQQFYVRANKDTASSTYFAEIVFDINGANGDNQLYDKTNSPNPDRFRLWVTADGNVTAGDAKGLEYLSKGLNWLKQDSKPENNGNEPQNTRVVSDNGCRPGTADCSQPNTVCNSETGNCDCKETFIKNANGECVCQEGYHEDNGVCVADGSGGGSGDDNCAENQYKNGDTCENIPQINLSYEYINYYTYSGNDFNDDIITPIPNDGRRICSSAVANYNTAKTLSEAFLENNVKNQAYNLYKNMIKNEMERVGYNKFNWSDTLNQHFETIYTKSKEDTYSADATRAGSRGGSRIASFDYILNYEGAWYTIVERSQFDNTFHWSKARITESFFTKFNNNVVNTLQQPLQQQVNNYYKSK